MAGELAPPSTTVFSGGRSAALGFAYLRVRISAAPLNMVRVPRRISAPAPHLLVEAQEMLRAVDERSIERHDGRCLPAAHSTYQGQCGGKASNERAMMPGG